MRVPPKRWQEGVFRLFRESTLFGQALAGRLAPDRRRPARLHNVWAKCGWVAAFEALTG